MAIDEEAVWAMLMTELGAEENRTLGNVAGQVRHGRIMALAAVLATDKGAYYSFEPDKVLIEAHHRARGGEPRR